MFKLNARKQSPSMNKIVENQSKIDAKSTQKDAWQRCGLQGGKRVST